MISYMIYFSLFGFQDINQHKTMKSSPSKTKFLSDKSTLISLTQEKFQFRGHSPSQDIKDLLRDQFWGFFQFVISIYKQFHPVIAPLIGLYYSYRMRYKWCCKHLNWISYDGKCKPINGWLQYFWYPTVQPAPSRSQCECGTNVSVILATRLFENWYHRKQ